ncbi:hypothetical protein ACFL7M_11390 [Thermodesulfobacteriota bacterium]
MEERDIYVLFSSVAENSARNNKAVKEVFSALIRSTLRYRDNMLKAGGTVLTVEDVRSALDWLVPSLKTGRLPQTDDKIKLDLLKLWLDELRCLGNPFV